MYLARSVYICGMHENAKFPSMGRLIGEAFEHWVGHQGRFWFVAGPAMVGLAVLPLVEISLSRYLITTGLDPLPSLVWAGIHVVIAALVLYQWFKYALHEDWGRRRHQLWQQHRIPWPAFVDAGFVAFWVLQLLLSRVALSLWGELVRSTLPSAESITRGAPYTSWLLYVPVVPLKEMALALIFGGFLLFLPARAAGIPWGPRRAFREAAGFRSRLIAIALFLAFFLVVGEKVLDISEDFILSRPNVAQSGLGVTLQFFFARGLLSGFVEFLALYVLAYAIGRLFLEKTGWKPASLPAPG